MNATITMTKDAKIYDREVTSLDNEKKTADILVTSIDGDYYSLFINNRSIDITIKRGVKRYNDRCIAVTENVFNKIKNMYKVMFDC